ncbi:outer membrane protein [Acinetobacter calcoaceticus]|uniref:Outer membrane protein n=1 Tax=Acinetobacter calcoaceticus TaxID=471 RepID=A0A4R1XZB5_ACICA|nr:outer membrane protein [Acinetobacter calcoaceticus]
MKALKLSLLALATSVSSLAQADFIGLTGDVSYWFYDGNVDSPAPYAFDQALKRDGAAQLSLAFEHPIPFVPNAKIKHVNLKADSKDQSILASRSSVDVSHTDFILYYELLDNVISADVGLGLARLDGDIKMSNPAYYKNLSISGNNPIVYASVGAKLPFTGLSAKGEAVYSNYDDLTLTDLQAELQYNFVQNVAVDVGAKLGYRYTEIKLDKNNDQKVNFDFKGPYLGLNVHF